MAEIKTPGDGGDAVVRDDTTRQAGQRSPVGICVSGGGVRAASFGLGALQALQDEEQLVYGPKPGRADFLAAVSGGCYMAGAITMLASDYEDGEPLVGEDGDARYPFAPGTPEVEFVRRRARYLVGKGVAEAVVNFVGRLGLNLLFVAAVIFLVARFAGWLYGAGLTDLREADHISRQDLDIGRVAWLTAASGVAFISAFLIWLRTTIWRGGFGHDSARKAGRLLFAVGVVTLLLGWAIPEWLGWVADRWFTVNSPVGETPRQAVSQWTIGSVVVAVTAAVTSLRTLVPEGVGRSALSRRARPLLLKVVRALAMVVAVVAVPLGVVAFATFVMIEGALNVWWVESGTAQGELLLYGGAVLVLVVVAVFRDPAIWSLHPFYKRRLMSCFAVVRKSPHLADERPYSTMCRLSKSQSDKLPELMVCAAANVSGFGVAPAGHNVLPFVFSPTRVGFTCDGGPSFDTAALEGSVSTSTARNLTLQASIAISGAAFSPSMGKMTIGPVRALLALLNLRLGLWVPNPANDDVRQAVENGQRVPRASAPWYLVKEGLGWHRLNDRLVYVSDGGHYENLGLVELLRKGCREIWCIDAAGDKPGRMNTLTEAMLLAESELGVRWIDTENLRTLGLDEEATRGRGLPTVLATHATVSFRLEDDEDQDPVPPPGKVRIVRLGITADAPEHLAKYQERRPTFPYDSTGNQLFRAERFDAYRSLGYSSTKAALADPAGGWTVEGAITDLPVADVAGAPPLAGWTFEGVVPDSDAAGGGWMFQGTVRTADSE